MQRPSSFPTSIRCIVIEDPPTGVAAGLAAGMTVYGYSALTPAHRLQAAGAHLLFDDMAELPNLIIDAVASAINP